MKIEVATQRLISVNAYIEVPVENWDEIEDWFIQGDALFYRAKGCTEHAGITLNSEVDSELVDWSESMGVQIFQCTDDGDADYDNPLVEDWS